uniref:Uncharacterized protein 17E5.175 n=1 Tax=Neurospora crassa TaxID=5141 RepID=Q96UD2_NEUCS|nr:hypothetical protein [Neurospora crassa]
MTRLVGEEEQAHASFPLSIVIRGSRVRIGSDTGRDGPSEELEILRRARRYVTSAPRESDSGSPFRHPSTCVTRCKLDMIVGNMYILLKSQARTWDRDGRKPYWPWREFNKVEVSCRHSFSCLLRKAHRCSEGKM